MESVTFSYAFILLETLCVRSGIGIIPNEWVGGLGGVATLKIRRGHGLISRGIMDHICKMLR